MRTYTVTIIILQYTTVSIEQSFRTNIYSLCLEYLVYSIYLFTHEKHVILSLLNLYKKRAMKTKILKIYTIILFDMCDLLRCIPYI